jgi:hypothetical protein
VAAAAERICIKASDGTDCLCPTLASPDKGRRTAAAGVAGGGRLAGPAEGRTKEIVIEGTCRQQERGRRARDASSCSYSIRIGRQTKHPAAATRRSGRDGRAPLIGRGCCAVQRRRSEAQPPTSALVPRRDKLATVGGARGVIPRHRLGRQKREPPRRSMRPTSWPRSPTTIAWARPCSR